VGFFVFGIILFSGWRISYVGRIMLNLVVMMKICCNSVGGCGFFCVFGSLVLVWFDFVWYCCCEFCE